MAVLSPSSSDDVIKLVLEPRTYCTFPIRCDVARSFFHEYLLDMLYTAA
jgi:hypothetical protein